MQFSKTLCKEKLWYQWFIISAVWSSAGTSSSSLLHIWALFFSSNLTHLMFILLLSFITYHSCSIVSCLLHICCNFVLLILHINFILPYIYISYMSHIIIASLVHIWCSFLQRRMDWQPINPADQFNCKKLPPDEFYFTDFQGNPGRWTWKRFFNILIVKLERRQIWSNERCVFFCVWQLGRYENCVSEKRLVLKARHP